MALSGNQKLVLVASLAAIALSLYSIFKPEQDIAQLGSVIMQGVADVAAEEIAKLAGSDAPVVLIHGAGGDMESPAARNLPEQLSVTIEKKGILRILARESVRSFGSDLSDLPEGAPVPAAARGPYPQLPFEIFDKAVREHPGVSAVISMIGPPRITKQDADRWRKSPVKVVVVMVTGDARTVEPSLKMGVTQLAVLPRIHSEPMGDNIPSSPRSWFDSQYQVITPQTLVQLK